MEKKPAGLISTNETTLRSDLLVSTPRLTPTGKISHAKTRVYTQRYRKEWEQMPDFKGWLTSVPFQPTRAYCTYCKKNLHAHRLSLLKHTCTMKHQRAALMHEAEERKGAILKPDTEINAEGLNEVEAQNTSRVEHEENDDEIEYVVERLEMDEDEVNETHLKEQLEVIGQDADDDEENEEDDMTLQMSSEEEDRKPVKKIKLEENCRDTLAEAMAHVHGEYLEETDDQGNVQMEMVVESETHDNEEMQVMTVLPDSGDGEKEVPKEFRENVKASRCKKSKTEKTSGTKMQDDAKAQSDSGIVVACAVPILGTTYQLNSPVVSTSGTIGLLQPINTVPITPAQSKTITLTTGGKTLTLRGDTFQPGSHYVLSKLKSGKLPTLVMGEKKSESEVKSVNSSKVIEISKVSQDQLAVAGTSRQSSNKHVLLKHVKSAVKKPRISTHIVDTSKGLPVGGLQVSLYKLLDGRWTFLNESTTGPNGRCTDLVDNVKGSFTAGRYKIHFDVDKYFTLRKIETMYPFIEIVFDVKNPGGHYHIPVLLSPFGYTTYRGAER